jgi:ligand-binding SRPBCC domain-containing protein
VPVFVRQLLVRAPVAQVFAFHEREDALPRLSPPFPPVRVVSREGGIRPGARVDLRIGPIRWLALHTAYEKNRLFVDEQIEGPFASWVHRHEFEAVDARTTRLTDHVTFTLPGGPIVNALFGRIVALSLVPMFRFRHQATKAACEVAGPSHGAATMGSVSGSDSVRPPVSGLKLTYDDFVQFPDDGKRHELIDGVHYVTPSPNAKHQTIVVNLTALLRSYLRTQRGGRLFIAPFDVVFSDFDVVEPDLLFVSKARQHDVLTAKHVRGAPDLVVEIGSPSTRRRDETTKRRLYERFGVSEYWVIDPELDVVKVYRLVEGRFTGVAELTAENDGVLSSPLFPDLDLRLVDLFDES